MLDPKPDAGNVPNLGLMKYCKCIKHSTFKIYLESRHMWTLEAYNIQCLNLCALDPIPSTGDDHCLSMFNLMPNTMGQSIDAIF